MRIAKRLFPLILALVLVLNLNVLPLQAATGKTDVQTTADNVQKVTSYATQLKNGSQVNVTTGNMGWDTEKKPYSWAYFNGLMLDAFMMMDPSGSSSYVEGFYRANINTNGTIVNLETGRPPKGALDNYEAMRAAFDLLPASREANRIKLGIQELYNQLLIMTSYSNCGGNYVHKQETDGTPSAEWAAFPVALDGLYMAQPFLMECANAIDRGILTLKDARGRNVTSESLYSAVYNRFTWIHNNLYNSSTRLFDHGYNPSSRVTNGVSWTRSIGWYAMALVDVIEMMPAGDRKTNLISQLPRLLDGMLLYQEEETGLWYNVTAYDSSLSKNQLETSGSAMMAYTIFKAYKNGWISDSKYAEAGLKAFNGVVDNKMTGRQGNYSVSDTYRSSGVSTDPDYYTRAPYTTNEAKGVGSLIMAATMANEVAKIYATPVPDPPGDGDGGSQGGEPGEGETETAGNESAEETTEETDPEDNGNEGETSGDNGSEDNGDEGGNSGDNGSEDNGNEGDNSGDNGSGDITTPLTITIHDSTGKAANSFEAYQIFTGILADTNSGNRTIAWANGIRTVNGRLQVAGTEYTAYELARAYTDGQISVQDMLDAMESNLSEINYTGQTSDDEDDVVISIPSPGYYFIRNTAGSAVDGEAYTRFIVRIVGSESIYVEAKTDAPSVDKKVKNNGEPTENYRDGNDGKIGDLINYRITSNVPDMSEYDSYVFTLHDTLSPGLTYMAGSLKILLADEELDSVRDYTLTTQVNTSGETEITIVFHNFIQYKGLTGTGITVTYDAVINDDAVVGSVGNPNHVYLTYSNDPNHSGDGYLGSTPKEWVKTYVACLIAYKYDGQNGEPLSGVTFTLTGVQEHSYSTNTDGSLQPMEITRNLVSDSNGFVDFGTLGEGIYKITEITTLNGYNLLKDDIVIKIQCDSDHKTILDGTEKCTWTITANDEPVSDMLENDLVHMQVDPSRFLIGIQNKQGTLLPSTGGLGTGLFYLIGSGLVLIAIVLLVSRRIANYRYN